MASSSEHGHVMKMRMLWNEPLVTAKLWAFDFDQVFSIPLNSNHRLHKLIRHFPDTGDYSVKSGYQVANTSSRTDSISTTSGYERRWN